MFVDDFVPPQGVVVAPKTLSSNQLDLRRADSDRNMSALQINSSSGDDSSEDMFTLSGSEDDASQLSLENTKQSIAVVAMKNVNEENVSAKETKTMIDTKATKDAKENSMTATSETIISSTNTTTETFTTTTTTTTTTATNLTDSTENMNNESMSLKIDSQEEAASSVSNNGTALVSIDSVSTLVSNVAKEDIYDVEEEDDEEQEEEQEEQVQQNESFETENRSKDTRLGSMPAIESTTTATTMTVEEVTELQLQIDSLMNELNAIKASNIVRRENNIVILNEKLKEHQKTMNVVQSTMNTIDQQHLKEIAQLNQTHTDIVSIM